MKNISITTIVLAWLGMGLAVFAVNTYRAEKGKSHWVGLGGGKSATMGAVSTIAVWPVAVFRMVKPA